MKKTIIFLCVVLIVVAIAFLVFGGNEELKDENITVVATTVAVNEVVNILKECNSLGDVAECFNMKSVSTGPDFTNFCTDYWAYSKTESGEEITYSTCVETMTDMATFIANNSDKVAVEKIGITGDTLTFEAYFKRHKGEICFSDEGYIYISLGDVTKVFEIGTEEYEKYFEKFRRTSCVWTPEHPVTMG